MIVLGGVKYWVVVVVSTKETPSKDGRVKDTSTVIKQYRFKKISKALKLVENSDFGWASIRIESRDARNKTLREYDIIT